MNNFAPISLIVSSMIGFVCGIYFTLKLWKVEITSTNKNTELTPYQRKLYEQYYRF